MNLKKTALSLFAAGSILLTGFVGATGAAAADPTTTGTVVVVGAGEFVPAFCSALSLSNATVTSYAGATATGTVGICIIDSQAYRGEFVMSVKASDFNSVTPGVTATISASNLNIVKTYNPEQQQWSTAVCGPYNGTNRPCIGDPAGLADSGAVRVTSGTGTAWTIAGPLSGSGQPVLHAWNGAGTSTSAGSIGTKAEFDVALTVPAHQRPATYQNTLTLTVAPVAP